MLLACVRVCMLDVRLRQKCSDKIIDFSITLSVAHFSLAIRPKKKLSEKLKKKSEEMIQ